MINISRVYKSILFILALSLTSCGSLTNTQDDIVTVKVFAEDDPAQDPEMVSFIQDPVEMSMPQGWRQEDINSNDELKFRFVKHDGSRLLIFCFGENTTQSDIRNVLHSSILSAMPDAVKTAGMYELDTPGIKPAFEMYKGTITVEGVDITMDANIAWRLDDRLGGCKYGLFYASASKPDKHNQYEFLAITRSLR
ncbi:MAG TPA: hypothetical protein VIQ03_04745 [Gammaproteobacteria bacterium]